MATQRYISTSFWDDKWIRSLDPSERYLYLYLLTNPQTNIAGIYEITIDRVAFDTGYDERTLRPMLKRYAEAGKAYFLNDSWVVIPSWPRHQKAETKATIRRGIDAILAELPETIWKMLPKLGYMYRFLDNVDRVQVPYRYPTNTLYSAGSKVPIGPELSYSDSDSDLDTDTDTDPEREAVCVEADAPSPNAQPLPPSTETKPATRPMSKMRDQTAQAWQDACTEHQPPSSWTNIGDERTACNTLAKKTKALVADTGASESDLIAALVHMYAEARLKVRRGWWAERPPVVPTEILKRWSEVVTWVAERFKDADRQRGSPTNGEKSEYKRARERALEGTGVESV